MTAYCLWWISNTTAGVEVKTPWFSRIDYRLVMRIISPSTPGDHPASLAIMCSSPL